MTVTINGTTGISSSGDITSIADMKAASYQESTATLTGTTPTVDCATGNVFTLTTSGVTAFQAATNVPTTGTGYSFMLKITAGGTHTVDYDLLGTNVYFAGGTAPEPPASGETDLLVFTTIDGGTTWYGALAVDAAS